MSWISTFLVSACLATAADAQCAEWADGFGLPGMVGVPCFAVFDDGTGSALYAAGNLGFVGELPVQNIARWTGSTWQQIPQASGPISTLVVFDDGTGPALYAGGYFAPSGSAGAVVLARFDGAAWTYPAPPLQGTPSLLPIVYDLTSYDDGSGAALYAVGAFQAAGAIPESAIPTVGIARWNGATWSGVGGGLALHTVFAAKVFDDGSGSALYAAGQFTFAGALPVRRIARWNGASWSDVGGGMNGDVAALAVHDDGSGAALYAAGRFTSAGSVAASRIAKWNGVQWSRLGVGLDWESWVLSSHDDGSGPALFVGGAFKKAGGIAAAGLAKWTGSHWLASHPCGVVGITPSTTFVVGSLASFDDGTGTARLFVGGRFALAGCTLASNIARFDGSNFSALATGLGFVDGAQVNLPYCMTVFDDGRGPQLFVGGALTNVAGVPAHNVVRWDGSRWSAAKAGVDGPVHALLAFDDDSGCRLYAGGDFTVAGGTKAKFIARWTGDEWELVPGGGLNGPVHALASFDSGSGPRLFVGGEFTSTESGLPCRGLASWDGSAWTPLYANGEVDALLVHDDGSGARLYIGGKFTRIGGVPANRIACFDGLTFAPLATGVDDAVKCLASFDDGNSSSLYVGGRFSTAGGITANRIARWNGTAWSPLGSGVAMPAPIESSAEVASLAVFDDATGDGPALYAGGRFFAAGGARALAIARWGASGWSSVDDGMRPAAPSSYGAYVQTLAVATLGAAGTPSLFAGGQFTVAGGAASMHFAAYRACSTPSGTPYCFGDGSLPTPCPCTPPDTVPNPSGAAGHGCANSFDLDGAVLSARGSAASDDVELVGRELTPVGFTFFFAGTAEIASGVAVSDGVRCAGGSLTRFGSQFAACGRVRYPNADAGWTLPLSVVSGTTPGSGVTKHYQAYYRNAAAGFCNPGTANLTNAYRIVW